MKTLLTTLVAMFALATPAFAGVTLDAGATVTPSGVNANSPATTTVGGAFGIRVGSKLGVLLFADVAPHNGDYPVRPGAAVVYSLGRHTDFGAGFVTSPNTARSYAPTAFIGYKF